MILSSGNQLTCGCDVLWIFNNEKYLDAVTTLSHSRCADGTLFILVDTETLSSQCANNE